MKVVSGVHKCTRHILLLSMDSHTVGVLRSHTYLAVFTANRFQWYMYTLLTHYSIVTQLYVLSYQQRNIVCGSWCVFLQKKITKPDDEAEEGHRAGGMIGN